MKFRVGRQVDRVLMTQMLTLPQLSNFTTKLEIRWCHVNCLFEGKISTNIIFINKLAISELILH